GVHPMRNCLDPGEVEGRLSLSLLLNSILDLLFTKVGVDHEARDTGQRRDALRINWTAINRAVKDDRRERLRLSQVLQIRTLNPDIIDNEDQLRPDFFNQRYNATSSPPVTAKFCWINFPAIAMWVTVIVSAQVVNLIPGDQRFKDTFYDPCKTGRHRSIAGNKNAGEGCIFTQATYPIGLNLFIFAGGGDEVVPAVHSHIFKTY